MHVLWSSLSCFVSAGDCPVNFVTFSYLEAAEEDCNDCCDTHDSFYVMIWAFLYALIHAESAEDP